MPSPPYKLGADPPSLTMLATIAHSLHLVRPLEDWLTPQGTFVFTRDGAAFLRDLARGVPWQGRPPTGPPPDPNLPRWDYQNRQLWLGDRLLKTYRERSGLRQIAILAAFEAEGWHVRRIDCPRPLFALGDRQLVQRRLYQIVRGLNQSLPADSLRFSDAGPALGVWWERVTTKVAASHPQPDPWATIQRPHECDSPQHGSPLVLSGGACV